MSDETNAQGITFRWWNIQISLTLFKCRNLALKDEIILNPYVYIRIGDFETAQTEVFYDTNEWTFDSKKFNFSLKLTLQQLKTLKISIEVWNKKNWYSFDSLVGAYSIDAFKVYSTSNHWLNQEWVNWTNLEKDAIANPGYVLFSWMVKGEKDIIVAWQQDQDNEQIDEEQVHKQINLNDVVQGKPPVDTSKKYSILINISKGQFLKDFAVLGFGQLSSFYKVKYSWTDDLKSGTVGNSCEPVFDDEISIPMSYPININFIVIEVYHDGGLLGKNVLIGKTWLNFDKLVKNGQLDNRWYHLYGPERENTWSTQIKTMIPSFLNFATWEESYFYFGRLLISAKFFQDDNPRCNIRHNHGNSIHEPEEKEYKLWVDIFQLLQDGGTNWPGNETLNVEIQIGTNIVSPKKNGNWISRFKRYEWSEKNDSRIKEKIWKLPADTTQIPDIFIRVYTMNLVGWKTYIGYERWSIDPFLKKKNEVKPQTLKLRKTATLVHKESETNYWGTWIYSLNFFQKNDLYNQDRPIPIQSDNKKKFKFISVIYMGKGLPLSGSALPTTYCSVDFNSCKTKSTRAFAESDCPVWGEALFISTFWNDCLDLSPKARITVYDKGLVASTEIGWFEVDISSVKEYIGQHNIDNEIYKLAKWYKLTDGIKVTKGEILAAFFIVKLTKQGKEEIDLKNKMIWPPQENYNLYLFVIGARNVKRNIEGCYTEARFTKATEKKTEKEGEEDEEQRKFIRYLTQSNTNNLNNFASFGENGVKRIKLYPHPLFTKPLSLVIKSDNRTMYTSVIDLVKIIAEQKALDKSANAIVDQDNPQTVGEQTERISSNEDARRKLKNREEIIPKPDDLIPWYKLPKSELGEMKLFEEWYYKTMENFPLTHEEANYSKGDSFTIFVKRTDYDKDGKEIKESDDKVEINRPEIDGDYEETLKDFINKIPFQTARWYGDAGDEEEEDIMVNNNNNNNNNKNNRDKGLVTGDKGIIRYIIRLADVNDTAKCKAMKTEVDTYANLFKSYYTGHGKKRLSPNFVCRIYIFNASNISLISKTITLGYVWTKRFEGDSEYKKSSPQDRFNIADGKVSFYDQINVTWPETFFLTVSLYGLNENSVFGDEWIGETRIDLEKRYFHNDYKSKLNKSNFSQIPIESRTLYNNGVSRGAIRMLVEIFPKAIENDFPKTSMEKNEKSMYQLRIVIWNCEEIPIVDNGKVDIMISAVCQDTNNPQKTDIHHNSTDGNGEFNWRMVFDIEYPSEKHYLQISAYDYNFASNNDPISNNSYDWEPFLKKIHKTRNTINVEKHMISWSKFPGMLGEERFYQWWEYHVGNEIFNIKWSEYMPGWYWTRSSEYWPWVNSPTTGRNLMDTIGLSGLIDKLGGIYDGIFKYVKYAIIWVAVGVCAYVISQVAVWLK